MPSFLLLCGFNLPHPKQSLYFTDNKGYLIFPASLPIMMGLEIFSIYPIIQFSPGGLYISDILSIWFRGFTLCLGRKCSSSFPTKSEEDLRTLRTVISSSLLMILSLLCKTQMAPEIGRRGVNRFHLSFFTGRTSKQARFKSHRQKSRFGMDGQSTHQILILTFFQSSTNTRIGRFW